MADEETRPADEDVEAHAWPENLPEVLPEASDDEEPDVEAHQLPEQLAEQLPE